MTRMVPASDGTALMAARICLVDGDAKMSPATDAASRLLPTYPDHAGSWPDPPPEMMDTCDWSCVVSKTTRLVESSDSDGLYATIPRSALVTSPSDDVNRCALDMFC